MSLKFSYFLFEADYKEVSVAAKELNLDEGFTELLLKSTLPKVVQASGARMFIALHKARFPEWFALARDSFETGPFIEGLRKAGYVQKDKDLPIGLSSLEFLLLVRVKGRIMAITGGQAWQKVPSTLLDRNFGRDVAMNWTEEGDLVHVESALPGVKSKQRAEKLSGKGSVYDFTPSEDLSILRRVGGKVKHGNKEVQISGAVSARFDGAASLPKLIKIAERLVEAHADRKSRPKSFQELEHVTQVDDPLISAALFGDLYQKLRGTDDLDYSIVAPDLEQYTSWLGAYRYRDKPKIKYEELPLTSWDASYFRSTIRDFTVTPEQFQDMEVELTLDGKPKVIDLVKFLSFVTADINGIRYVLDDGKWFKVSSNLHDRVMQQVKKITALPTGTLPAFKASYKDEGEYNADTCETFADKKYSNLDRADCRKAIGRSRVEACDIFTPDGDLFCVKKGTGSTPVAVVSRQAVDSAFCLDGYDDYWPYLFKKLKHIHQKDPSKDPEAFRFVVSLITKNKKPIHECLPFKSCMAIVRCKKDVRSLGFGFALLKVEEQ